MTTFLLALLREHASRLDRRLGLGLSVLVASALCVGCAGSADEAAPVGRWVPLAPDQALVRLPADSPATVLAGRQRQTLDGDELQDLTLSNDTAIKGENDFAIAREAPGGRLFAAGASHGPSPVQDMGEQPMARMAAAAFPDAARVAPPAGRGNRYGRYLYVVADYADGSRCVLAWQVIGSAPSLLEPAARRVSVRLRNCDRHGDLAAAVGPFDHFVLATATHA